MTPHTLAKWWVIRNCNGVTRETVWKSCVYSDKFTCHNCATLDLQTVHLMKTFYNGRLERELKTLDTIGNFQRPVFSLAVSQHMHKTTSLWKFQLNRSSSFQVLDFETSNSKSEVLKSNSWKITSFSKTTPLQREQFLTMFYIITPLTNILPFHWFRARHMRCLSFARRRPCDGASVCRVIVHRFAVR
jgi:hypothetical protein